MKQKTFGAFAILLIAFAFSLLLAGCIQPPASGDLFKNAVFSQSIKGCAETDKGTAAKAVGDFQARAPSITVQGNSIVYDRAISHLCCRKAEITKEFYSPNLGNDALPSASKEFGINIFEAWSGLGCKCMCYSELGAKIENLAAGKYYVRVVEQGTNPDGSEMQAQTIISQAVIVQ